MGAKGLAKEIIIAEAVSLIEETGQSTISLTLLVCQDMEIAPAQSEKEVCDTHFYRKQ